MGMTTTTTATDIPRAQWVRMLTAMPEADVVRLGEELAEPFTVAHKALPQAGLGLLRMEDGALADSYFLGEIPVAMAWVELRDAAGRVAEGAAQVMADSAELAVALAVCDAILANRLLGHERVARQMEAGAALRHDEDRRRRAMLLQTRVDFSLISVEGTNGD